MKGVLISGVRSESFAEDAGLRVGDVLQQIETDAVAQIDGFRTLCRLHSEEQTEMILTQVRRGRVVAFHVLKPFYKESEATKANNAGEIPAAGGRTP